MKKSVHNGRRTPAVPEAEQIARYRYLVDTLPLSVTLKAHAEAFTDLSADQRAELLDRLRAFVPQSELDAASDEPDALATVVRDAEPRDAMMRASVAGVVAARFVHSAPVVAYFTVGVGSVTIDDEPPWVSEMVDHDSAPLDGGTMHHSKGMGSGWGFG